ncbi:inverse autotransporter beta domain-containing protein [Salmonella enterica]|nr:inverse autotransporter beta domain-containing protein [Salmonella enterica]ELF4913994.1 inverse autotransporter beta domain-containing protein [Salmonella enterica]
MNRKKHSTPPAETLNGCVRFRRTVLFAAVLQAMLPVLTACSDAVAGAQATRAAQEAQAAHAPAQKNIRPRSPFRVDREAAPAPQAATASRSPFRVDRETGGLSPSPAPVSADDLPSLGSDPAGGSTDDMNASRQAVRLAQEHRDAQQDGAAPLASAASTAGALLQNTHTGDAAASMARDMATGKANQTVQDWLSQFGNARVQLNADSDFSLKNSALDLLHPWYETPDDLFFSQGSLHRTDSRGQANLGFGWRHWTTGTAPRGLFHGDYMTGLNTFLDYDLSRDHARMGIGAEFWRDYLKLGANVYHRLTNWKNSPDLDDYEERPADGWDLRMEGWLPSYPQLGGRLTWEQYYGNQVGLFGYDDLQSNPRALTAGLTWTPFPLMTVSAGRRQGQHGHFETEFGVNFTLNPDLTWQQQTDPAAVAAMRTLAGSRHDFVERNNNIVLEYRKKTVIAIALPERVEGKSGMQYPLSVTVSKAKYGLQDIVWDDAAFLAAGGKLTCTGSTACTVTMPPFHPGAENTYTVGAVAHDRKGNESERAQTTLTVTGVGVSAANSTLGAQPDTLLADGQSQTTVTVVLKSGDNQPATGLADQLALSGKLTPDSGLVTRLRSLLRNRAAAREPVLTTLKEDSTQPGTYTATLTAGTTAGKYALTLALSGEPLLNAQVLLTDTMADTSQSGLTADKNQIAASDGTDPQNRVTFTATLTDRDGKPVSGEAGRLKLATTAAGVDTARLTFSDLKESQPGVYTGTLSSTLAVKDLPVVLMINGKNSGKTATVTVTADDTSATPVLTVTKNSAVADGQDADTLAVAVTDKYTNPVENQAVTLSATPADVTFAATPVTTGPDGKTQATLTSLTPGDKAITATLANGNSAQENVTFLPDPNAVVNTLAVTDHAGQTTDSLPVGTTDASAFTVTAKVQDSSGNPAPANLKVNWTLDQATCRVPAGTLKDASSLTDATGHAVMTITSADPHKACDGLKVTAVVDGATRSATATLKYTADAASAKVDTVTMTSDHTVFLADGKDSAEYTAAVTDQYGNPVAGTAVTWTTTGGKLANAQTTTDPQGNTSGALTDTQAETVTVSAAAGTSQPTAADKTVEFRTATLQDNTPDAKEKPVGDGPGSTFTFTATVKDNTGAPVKDAEIKWTQDGGTDYRLSADTVRTDDQGQAQVTLTDPMHKATDRITVTATYNGRSVGADVAYVADATTAAVSALTLADPTVTTREANGTDAFTWNALVTDQYGNKVKNADVTWSTDTTGTPPVQTTSQTGNTGEAGNTLVSATAVSNVHMQAKTAVQQTAYTSPVGVSFVVQGAATITGQSVVDNSVADGATADVVTITVTDPAGNPVTGVDLTADLSKSNGVQTTDGKTTRALDAAGKATISFTTTVAGTHSIAFSVPDSANARAGAGTVSITFVAGPVDAAQSEVTVPVGAAVQGDPLELHLYARDANRNPVTAAQLDKVIVAIAATGTGITLTATPQGDDTDATGPYRKYSLVPDTASYATQAIRYNTVTVQVNGANVGTQYHAAWSPDITLDRSNAPAYSDADVNRIIKSCSADLVVDTSTPDNWKVFTTTQDFVGTHEFECGQDTQTALRPKVKYTAQLLPDVTVHRVGTKYPDDWTLYGGSIETSDSAGWKARSGTATRSVSRGVTGAAMELPRRTYIGRRINVVTQDASGATTGDKLIVPYAVGLLTKWYTGKNATYTPEVPSGFTVSVKGSKMTGYPVAMKLEVTMYVYKTASELFTGIFSLHDITRSTVINALSIDMQTDLKGVMQLYAAEGIDPGNGYMYTDAAEDTVRAYTEWGGNGYQTSVRLLTDEHAQGEGNFGNDNNVSNPHYLHIRF